MCGSSRIWFAALTLTGVLVAADAPTKKDEWPVFRSNPQQTGIASSKIPAKVSVLWTYKADDAFENTGTVAKGILFAASMDEHLYAIDLATGKPKWKYKAGPFKSSPIVVDGTVYVGDLDGNFHAVDAEKGSKRWIFEAGAEIGGANYYQNSILFTSHDETLYCMTKEGKVRWKFKTEGPIYGAPTVSQGQTFLVGCDSQLHVIDIEKGKEIKAVDLGGQTGATAGVLKDRLYVGTMSNVVKEIDLKKGAEGWTYKAGRNAQVFSSPAVTEKYVVVGARDNNLHCIDRLKGTEVWKFPTGNRVDSSPVISGTAVIVGSLDGKLYILDLASGKEAQKFTLDAPISASPVVVDGKILIGTQKGTLYCLGAKK